MSTLLRRASQIEYSDVQYLTIKDIKIGYFVIKNNTLNNYIVWVNSTTDTTEHIYAKLLKMASHLETNIILFDYQGKGRSEGKYSDYNSYITLKSIMKNINTITNEPTLNKHNVVLCGEEYGTTLIRRYIRHHKYNKCIMINPPSNYLRSYDNKKKKNKVKVLSTSAKNIAYDDVKYFKGIHGDEELTREISEFLNY